MEIQSQNKKAWKDTLRQMSPGQTCVFKLSIKEVFSIRNAAHRLKKEGEAEFVSTIIDEERIQITRVN